MADETISAVTIPARTHGVIVRPFGAEAMLTRVSTDMVHTLNESGAMIFELIDGLRSAGDIRDLLLESVEAPADDLLTDVLDLLQGLRTAGFIEPVGQAPPT